MVGQGPTTVCAAADGTPLRPAITWLDTRAQAITAELETRLAVPSWFLGPLPHERWLAQHEPELHARTAAFLLPWDWLALRLTGEAIRSVPPVAGHPKDSVIAAGGGDPTRFGRTVEWGTSVGPLTAAAAADLWLEPGIPVISGGNDALVSFHGAGMRHPGDAIDTGGTSGGFAVYWDALFEIQGTYRAAAVLPGMWWYGGAMNATGRSLDWLRGLLDHHADDPAELLAAAARTEPGADGLVFLPYLAGERSPIWDERARGVFAGLTPWPRPPRPGDARGRRIRAAARGGADPRPGHRGARDGGLGRHHRDATLEPGEVGHHGLPHRHPGGVGDSDPGRGRAGGDRLGAYPDAPAAMAAMVRIAERLEPRPALRSRYDALYSVYRELYPATKDLVHRLGDIAAG